jgi:hypothetical protein
MTDRPQQPTFPEEMPEFVRLLTQFQQDVYLFIRSLLPDPHEASEVLQDTTRPSLAFERHSSTASRGNWSSSGVRRRPDG